MKNCNKCKKNKDVAHFTSRSKIYMTCEDCRTSSRVWRDANKQRVKIYNKFMSDTKQAERTATTTTQEVIYARKKNSDGDWLRFNSQAEAARLLNVQAPNISHVLNGKLQTTGGYLFKRQTEPVETDPQAVVPSWEDVKEEHGFVNACVGQPVRHRISHEEQDSVVGKKCCTCETWRPLADYNINKDHWDGLRNDCKKCLLGYRQKNRTRIGQHMKEYERKRKAVDPIFKLTKTLRSRLGIALKRQFASKSDRTLQLIGCSIQHLKSHLQSKFQDGMTWENRGEWHIDHIRPCASFNLSEESEQRACFHYTNLQPLWARDNLSKGAKIIDFEFTAK